MSIYLDYNATAPVRPQVVARMQEILAVPANPSSVHSYGRQAKKWLEDARKTIADAISAWPNEVIFTATGTEANAMALKGFLGRRVLASAVEHSSVLSHTKEFIPVDCNGLVDLQALEEKLSKSGDTLVSIMLANNETGVIQPIMEIAAICKKHGALLHADAVQALGKIPVDFGALGVDMMSISTHKCGGPIGAAALVIRRDLPIQPLFTGGGQELRRRAGTENVAAIAGFAKAVELFDFGHMRKLRGWLDGLEEGQNVLGKGAERLPNTSCIAMPGVSNEVQLMGFDLEGFAVSAGSACSSGRIEPSHVLKAMGIAEVQAKSAIRVSGGWQTTENDIISFTNAWIQTYKRLAKSS